MTEFENQNATGLEMRGGLRNEVGVEFVTFFAAEQRHCRFMITDFACQLRSFAAADVWRISRDQIKTKRRIVRGDW